MPAAVPRASSSPLERTVMAAGARDLEHAGDAPRAHALLGTRAPERRGRTLAPVLRALARYGGAPAISVHGPRRSLGGGALDVTVYDDRAYVAALRGSAGLGRAYIAGWWDTADLTATLRAVFRRTALLRHAADAFANLAPLRAARDALARPGRPGRPVDEKNVRAHYDLSNEFFEIVLDETMTYSCAVFPTPATSLRDAQLYRIDGIFDRLGLAPGDRLLEIGSGWGELAARAAEAGSEVVTTTISERQRAYVTDKIRRRGLDARVAVLGRDWRDLEGSFDKLVSVEMIEAVDWRNYDEFFSSCARRLRPGGSLLLQAIVIDDASFHRAKRRRDFIKSMVFPGSCIPSRAALRRAIAASGLEITATEEIGAHYPETLRRWAATLDARSEDLDRIGASPELRRLFRFYLSYCEAGFEEGHLGDVQLLCRRPVGCDAGPVLP